MTAKVKLITSNTPERFEEWLARFLSSLGEDTVVVDIKFSTAAVASHVEYSALVHYQATEGWQEG